MAAAPISLNILIHELSQAPLDLLSYNKKVMELTQNMLANMSLSQLSQLRCTAQYEHATHGSHITLMISRLLASLMHAKEALLVYEQPADPPSNFFIDR